MSSVVICVRDPDAANEFIVIGEHVEIVDVDLGYADLYNPAEWAEWFDGKAAQVGYLMGSNRVAAGEALASILRRVAEQFGHSIEGRL